MTDTIENSNQDMTDTIENSNQEMTDTTEISNQEMSIDSSEAEAAPIADNQSVETSVNGVETHDQSTSAPAEPEQPKEVKPDPTKLERERLLKLVSDHPENFDAFCELVSHAEKSSDPVEIRRALDLLLQEYPLCYGYWQRWANHEKSWGEANKWKEVYERGVNATPHSPELWVQYCTDSTSRDTDPEIVRSLFERGAAAVHNDYNCHIFWERYLEFEIQQAQKPTQPEEDETSTPPSPPPPSNVGSIYSRIFTVPMKELDKFYSNFLKWATGKSVSELCTPSELEQLKSLCSSAAPTPAPPTPTPTPTPTPSSEGESSETPQPSTPVPSITTTDDNSDDLADPSSLTVQQIETRFRRKIMSVRETTFQRTKTQREERYQFETKISRPYFHVAPLDPSDIANWHNYLDFAEQKLKKFRETKAEENKDEQAEMQDNDVESSLNTNALWVMLEHDKSSPELRDLIKLYERCLVTAANYPEFWERYSQFMEKNEKDVAAARQIIHRATTMFLKSNIEVLLSFANFEERYGQYDRANQIYLITSNHKTLARLLEVIIAHANFLRRQAERSNNFEAAYSFYNSQIEAFKESPDDFKSLVFVILHYARFAGRVACDANKAREAYEVLASLLVPGHAYVTSDNTQTLAVFWFSYIEAESNHSGVEAVSTLFDRFLQLESILSEELKQLIWEQYVNFMEDRAKSLADIESVKVRYHAVVPSARASKKRKATTSAGRPPSPKARKLPPPQVAAANRRSSYSAVPPPSGPSHYPYGSESQSHYGYDQQQPPVDYAAYGYPGYGQQYQGYPPAQPAAQQGYGGYPQGGYPYSY